MALLQIVVLAILQGITEFLPVSSSGHLILVPHLTGWPDQGLPFDVAIHVGTLVAVLVYFWRDVGTVLVGMLDLLRGRRSVGTRLVIGLAVATIPALAMGLAMEFWIGDALRSVTVVAWTMIIFAVVLYVSDRLGLTINRMEHLTVGHAFFIGCAQALAFIPGTSRSGITMVAGRILGYERFEAARFSLLLSVPAITAAGLYEGLKLYRTGDVAMMQDAVLGGGIAAVSGLITIVFMMNWLRRATFTPFVIYRLILGSALLAWVYLL